MQVSYGRGASAGRCTVGGGTAEAGGCMVGMAAHVQVARAAPFQSASERFELKFGALRSQWGVRVEGPTRTGRLQSQDA